MPNKDLLNNVKKLRELTGVGFKDCKIAIEENKQLHELSLDKLKTLHPLIDADVFHYITYQAAVSAKSIEGGTAPSSVKQHLNNIKRRITWKKH